MYKDPIVEEVHQARAQILAKHKGNFEAYFAALMQTQQAHPERYVSFDLQNPLNQVGDNSGNRQLANNVQAVR